MGNKKILMPTMLCIGLSVGIAQAADTQIQAADRAHRIGQTRPVTVYRLVTTDTIEEKIVQLHHEKRNLANSLLEGTDSGARISADELLELIRAS